MIRFCPIIDIEKIISNEHKIFEIKEKEIKIPTGILSRIF